MILLTASLMIAGMSGVQSIQLLGRNVAGFLLLGSDQAHRGRVVDAAWRLDGTQVASLGNDERSIWDARQMTVAAEYPLVTFGRVGATNTVSWQPRGDVIVLTVETGSCYRTLVPEYCRLVSSVAAWRPPAGRRAARRA